MQYVYKIELFVSSLSNWLLLCERYWILIDVVLFCFYCLIAFIHFSRRKKSLILRLIDVIFD